MNIIKIRNNQYRKLHSTTNRIDERFNSNILKTITIQQQIQEHIYKKQSKIKTKTNKKIKMRLKNN